MHRLLSCCRFQYSTCVTWVYVVINNIYMIKPENCWSIVMSIYTTRCNEHMHIPLPPTHTQTHTLTESVNSNILFFPYRIDLAIIISSMVMLFLEINNCALFFFQPVKLTRYICTLIWKNCWICSHKLEYRSYMLQQIMSQQIMSQVFNINKKLYSCS